MSEKTKVQFRVFPEGDVIALFPDMDEGDYLVGSYQRIGQHGAAHISLLHDLRQAVPAEYEPLKEELESIGYELEL